MNSVAMDTYGAMTTELGLMDAPPEKLVLLLLDGAASRLNSAIAAMEGGNIAKKGELISKSISIIGYLSSILDRDPGPEIADNLSELYDYMGRRLLAANLNDDQAAIREVVDLLGEVRSGWSEMMTMSVKK